MDIANPIRAFLVLCVALAPFAPDAMARPTSAAAGGLEISTEGCAWRSAERADGTRIQQTRECPDSDLRVRRYQYPDGTTGTKVRTRMLRFQDVRRHSGRRDLYLRFHGERGLGLVSIQEFDSQRVRGAEHLPNLSLDGRLISGRAGDTVLLFSDGVATARLVGNESTSVPPSALAADSSGDLRLESEPLLQASLESGLGSEGLLFGDSILQLVTGWGASNGLPKPRAFLDLWSALGNGDDVLNFAITGDSTQGNLYRAQWTPASLQWAVVHVGTNNLARGVAPQEVAEAQLAIAAAIRAKSPAARLFFVALTPVSDACAARNEYCGRRRAGIPEANRLTAAAIEELGTGSKASNGTGGTGIAGIHWIDPLEDSGLDIENPAHSFDGLHLARTGAELYFSLVADALHGGSQAAAGSESGRE